MNNSFSEQKEKAATQFFCALVLRCSLQTFEDIKNYVVGHTPTQLIFQRYSTEYLRIEKAPPKEALDT